MVDGTEFGFLKGRSESTQLPPVSVSLSRTIVGYEQNQCFYVPTQLGEKDVATSAFIDSGAGGIFVHPRLVIRLRLLTTPLASPILVFNVDDTPNKRGKITHSVTFPMTIAGETRITTAYVANIGRQDFILGLPWLKDENPDINWKTHEVR